MSFIYSTIDELLIRAQPIPISGCFIWELSLDKSGYARVAHNGKTSGGHRLAYELKNGSIPPGISVCHKCDIASCINPNHLFLGTHLENMKDMVAKKRSAKHEKHSQSKLNIEKVKEIRLSKLSPGKIAKIYGVHRKTIEDVLKGITWKDIS